MSYCINRSKKCGCSKQKTNNNIDVRCPQYTLACKSINSAMRLSAGKDEKLFTRETYTKDQVILPPKLNIKTLYKDKCCTKYNCKYPERYKISNDLNSASTAQNGGPEYNYSAKQGIRITDFSQENKYNLYEQSQPYIFKECEKEKKCDEICCD